LHGSNDKDFRQASKPTSENFQKNKQTFFSNPKLP
jgi:hypothetical protein